MKSAAGDVCVCGGAAGGELGGGGLRSTHNDARPPAPSPPQFHDGAFSIVRPAAQAGAAAPPPQDRPAALAAPFAAMASEDGPKARLLGTMRVVDALDAAAGGCREVVRG